MRKVIHHGGNNNVCCRSEDAVQLKKERLELEAISVSVLGVFSSPH